MTNKIIEFVIVAALLILMALVMDAENILDRIKKGERIIMLDNKWYDVLKWCSIVALPAISTFIVVISKIWGWADLGSMIAQTITAVAVLLGALLGISHIQYKNGENNADS